MSEQRRQALEALLATDAQHQPAVSRISLICELCVRELGVSGAGATVLAYPGNGDGGGQATRRGLVQASNEVSSRLEDLQLTVGEGPCLDTFTSGGPVLVDDLAQAHWRWPAFAEEAQALGTAAVFSFPLQVGVIRLGSLDCYRDTTGPFGEVSVADALILADLATRTIMTDLDGHATDDVSWLADPHTVIHQASGMVRVQTHTSTEAALLRMRGYAYTHQLALSEVARQVVSRELRFSADLDPSLDPLS